jgi:predicted nucleic acid-binding Zn ribbon protein
VGSLVGQVLGELGLDAAAGAFRIGERWEEAVGPEVARHSRPVAMRGRTLEVDVDSPVWGQQLQLLRPELLSALAAVLGEDAPSDLRFRVGYIRRP